MSKQTIQTNLIGERVIFDPMPREDVSGKTGTVRAVYLMDGRPMFLIQMDDTDRMVEMTSMFFKVLK